MTRFKYYTIYRCRTCGQQIRVHGKLTSKLVLPSGVQLCCKHPRLQRERHVLISEYKSDVPDEQTEKRPKVQQRSLSDF
jgi:hypothetical protein